MAMELGITSYTYRNLGIMDVLPLAKTVGAAVIDLWPSHIKDMPAAEIGKLRARFNDEGIRFCGYGVVGLGAAAPMVSLFATAQELGVDYMSVDVAADDIDTQQKALALAEQYDVKLGIHNHGPQHRYSTPADVLKVIGRWPERFGACVDTGHYLRSNVDPVEAIQVLSSRVHGVHIKDFIDVDTEALPGTGRLDLARTVDALRSVHFRSALVIEYEAEGSDPTPDLLKVTASLQAVM